MPVRAVSYSNIEEKFLLESLVNGTRLDKRGMLKHRCLKVSYGLDYGCCTVDLGSTKVMAQVACVLDRPKESRPNEGRLTVHVEMSAIAFPTFDPTKMNSNLGVTIQRMLERTILLSRAIDLEELCVQVGDKVWSVHLYVHVLSHDGSIIDCSFISAIAALKHFRRPDVTIVGRDVVVHSVKEKNPLPLIFHHLPLCVSFAFFNNCSAMVVDATYLEEKVMDGMVMICMNKHGEMCSMQMDGEMTVSKDHILRCAAIAASKVKDLTAFLIRSLDVDKSEKQNGKTFSCAKHLPVDDDEKINKSSQMLNRISSEELNIVRLSVSEDVCEKSDEECETSGIEDKVKWLRKFGNPGKSASVGEGCANRWFMESNKPPCLVVNDEERRVDEHSNNDSSDDENLVVLKSEMSSM